MKVKIELFGAARDFSDQNILELTLNNDSIACLISLALVSLETSNVYASVVGQNFS